MVTSKKKHHLKLPESVKYKVWGDMLWFYVQKFWFFIQSAKVTKVGKEARASKVYSNHLNTIKFQTWSFLSYFR